MGDFADDAEHAWLMFEAERSVRESILTKAVKSKVWITKDEKEIKIKDMEISHIQNCIRKIERDNWRLDYLSVFKKELEKRKIK